MRKSKQLQGSKAKARKAAFIEREDKRAIEGRRKSAFRKASSMEEMAAAMGIKLR